MDLALLDHKWTLLEKENLGSLKTLRIDSLSQPDLYLGIKEDRKRCLVLKLPVTYTADFQSSAKQNLSLELFQKTGWVLLTLLDDQYSELFNDLIFSIYNKIANVPEASIYVSDFLKTYYKWSEFFQEVQNDDLTEDAVRGLLGELWVLKDMLTSVGSSQVNEVLISWRGPYDAGHDFVGEFQNTEIKTRLNTSSTIKISSEYQLQSEIGKAFELIIVTITSDPIGGITLSDVSQEIKNYVTSKSGDFSIFLKAIARKGLTLSKLTKYDYLRFSINSVASYSCYGEGFPKLIRSDLHDAISDVTYRLNVQALTPFLSKEVF